MSRGVTILGSTGSVGTQTLDILRAHKGDFHVTALAGGSNAALLAEQAREFKPAFVAIADTTAHPALKAALEGTNIETDAGPEAVIAAAELASDVTMAAIVGCAGLAPTMAAIARGGTVAFASKECLVAAGRVMMRAVAQSGATLLPVDSEHNAIYQVLETRNAGAVRRIVLTASGGPFREWTYEKMQAATPEQAIAHPTWAMGKKISVDSATLMNKALEVIEAHHLFALPSEKIDVVIHPQSAVHGVVEYGDGSLLAQMGPADMRTPLTYCLGWPGRISSPGARLDLAALSRLDFFAPDEKRFPALRVVREVLASSPAAAIVFNAANEEAVAAFLDRRISFTNIVGMVETMLAHCHMPAIGSIEDVIACDRDVRARMHEELKKKAA